NRNTRPIPRCSQSQHVRRLERENFFQRTAWRRPNEFPSEHSAIKHGHEHFIRCRASLADAGIPHVLWFGGPVLSREVSVLLPTASRCRISGRCSFFSFVGGIPDVYYVPFGD